MNRRQIVVRSIRRKSGLRWIQRRWLTSKCRHRERTHTHTHTEQRTAAPNATSVFLLWPFVPGVRQQGNTNMAASPEQQRPEPRLRDAAAASTLLWKSQLCQDFREKRFFYRVWRETTIFHMKTHTDHNHRSEDFYGKKRTRNKLKCLENMQMDGWMDG